MKADGIAPVPEHYRRLEERPFTADQRAKTTILFGNLTPKHEAFAKAVFERVGFRMQNLPAPTKQSIRAGREYCNNGLCNPVWYTFGTLIQYLRDLEAQGLSRRHIVDNYLFLTASDCGPCRFGMYESEHRQALHNAGYEGFRVITAQLNKSSRSAGEQPGLEFSPDLALGLANGLILGDLLYGLTYQMRPFELHPGDTDRAMEECTQLVADFLSTRGLFELRPRLGEWLGRRLGRPTRLESWLNALGKFRRHFYGGDYRAVLKSCAERLDRVELDRTRSKPVVKIVGEFYSHLAENAANYDMFSFLESEGAQVEVPSIGNHFQYWFHKSRLAHLRREGLDRPPDLRWWQLLRRLGHRLSYLKKPVTLALADRIFTHLYHRAGAALGGLAHRIVPIGELAALSAPYYHPLTRGGEGFLEVAKSIHYTQQHKCHMVLSLKPFGCMPSTQSDGVMATVTSRYDDMLFASIETTGDGDINAFSRVQMVLSDAKRKAKKEFQGALESTGKRLEDIRAYVADRPELRRPSYHYSHRPGVAGVAASYVMHVSELMDRERSR